MSKVLLTKQDIERTINRISYEIIERNKEIEDIVLVGIKTRGINISNMICDKIFSISKIEVVKFELDVNPYRDDIDIKKIDISNIKNNIKKTDLENKKIIIVDDVLYTGRTIRSALNAILEIGRPKNIQLAVLIDRGHRELPIKADYIGKNIPTSRTEKIKVKIEGLDDKTEILLV